MRFARNPCPSPRHDGGGSGTPSGSSADLAVSSFFVNLMHAGETVDASRWPQLAAYVGRNHARPSFKAVIEEEKAVQREMLLNDGDMSFISSDDEDFRWIDDYSQGRVEVGLDTGDEKLIACNRIYQNFVHRANH